MGQFNWRKKFAIEQRYNETIGKDIPHSAGIYLWKRQDGETTYFYIGQAKDLNKRRFDYYSIQCGLSYPTRHFEASLKKHKDWEFRIVIICDESRLNELEKYYIGLFNSMPNHITRNELLAGKDIVKSNAKRIEQLTNKYNKKVYECLRKLNYWLGNEDDPEISFWPKENKQKGDYNKNSMKAFKELQQWFREIIENGNKTRN